MMPPKRKGNGASGEMRKMNLLTQTTIINYNIIMRSVNANLLAINQAKKEGKTSVGLNAPTTQEGGGDGTSGGGSATGGSENTGGSDVDIYVEMPTQVFPCGLSESIP